MAHGPRLPPVRAQGLRSPVNREQYERLQAVFRVVTAMGRMAAHTGQAIIHEQLAADHFASGIDKLTMDSDSPLMRDEHGVDPVPEPGIGKTRGY